MILYNLQIKTVLTDLRTLAENYKTGKWVAYSKWLQRLEQEKKWTSKDREKAKSYLKTLLHTQGAIQGFLVCEIKFLKENIQEQKTRQPNLADLWSEMLEWIEGKEKDGATHIILDGQNRLKFAISHFIFGDLSITLNIDGVEKNNVLYKDLDADTKEQVDKHQVLLSIATSGDVTSVVQSLIAINEGEPWSENEKRCNMMTPISVKINNIATFPQNVSMNNKLKSTVYGGEKYTLSKKGDIRFIAEYLHYLRNGKVGTEKSLTTMYKAADENIKGQLKRTSTMFEWMSKHLSASLISKIESKEVFRDLFIFTSMLTNKSVPNSGELVYNVELNQIKTPEIYLDKVINKVKFMLADPINFAPTTDKKGKTVYKVANALPGSFYLYHKNSTEIDLRGREKHFIQPFNNIIDECINEGVIVTENPRRIDKFTKMQVEQKYNGDIYERFPTENLDVVSGKEIDHYVSVKNNGTNDIENLNYTSKSHNRALGAK